MDYYADAASRRVLQGVRSRDRGRTPELAEHRRTLLNEEAGEAAEAFATLAEALRTGDDPVTAYQAVAEELADVLYVT